MGTQEGGFPAQGFLSNLEQNTSFPVNLYKSHRLAAQTIMQILFFLHRLSNEVVRPCEAEKSFP